MHIIFKRKQAQMLKESVTDEMLCLEKKNDKKETRFCWVPDVVSFTFSFFPVVL